MKLSTFAKGGLLAGAMAIAGSANAMIIFDNNGDTAPGGTFYIDGFDWQPDNALFEGVIPIPTTGSGFVDGNLRVQGKLTSSVSAFIAAGTEVTYQTVVPIRVATQSEGGGISLRIDRILDGGYFDIFWDDFTSGGIAGNDITGLGYGDGRKILHSDVLSSPSGELGSIVMLPCSSTNGCDGLDQFLLDGDHDGGVTTLPISGNFPTFRMEITADSVGNADMTALGYDTSFFPADLLGNTIDVVDDYDFTMDGDNLAAFRNVNPSDSVVGVAPDYGNNINDNLCGATSSCDLHVETDTRSPFRADMVPEPTTTALLGLSLLALGASARASRRNKA